MALGYVPLYNHSYKSNCEYEMDFDRQLITIRTVRFIKAGEEIFINYNGDWNNKTPVWFHSDSPGTRANVKGRNEEERGTKL